ncbi:MAG: DNA polymerase III subunit gamma/tau C-terminal domain-containing protein, partial [Psychromonas sp.]
HQVALLQIHNTATTQDKNTLQLLAERLTPEEVQLYYQIAVQGYKDFAFAPNGKIALEMTVMRLLAFKPANYIDIDAQQLSNVAVETVASAIHPQVTPPIAQARVDAPSKNSPSVVAVSNESAANSLVSNLSPAVVTNPVESVNISQGTATENLVADIEQVPLQETLQETVEPSPAIKVEAKVVDDTADEQTVEKTEVVAQQNNNTAEITESVAPIKAVASSINMLRSHRLKREEAKKSQATTVETRPVVAAPKIERTVAPEVVQPPVTAQKSTRQQVVQQQQPDFDSTVLPLDAYQQDDRATTGNNATQFNDFAEPDVSFETLGNSDTGQISNEQPSYLDANLNSNQSSNITNSTSTDSDILADTETQLDSASDGIFVNEQFESSEIDIAKYVEDKLTDPWALDIQKMQLAGLVKLLAKNSVMTQTDQQVVLVLKAEQQHLLNNSQLCEQLEAKVKEHFGSDISLYIKVGNVEGRFTAAESEMQIFQQYLDNAKRGIKEDKNILTFVRDYGAKIYENSVIPL